MNNSVLGNYGEEIAQNYLLSKNYKIIQRNFSCPCGEIDIIASDRGVLVFVEVKTRMSEKYGLPSDAVTRQKQLKIARTAAFYLKRERKTNVVFRFDVISILDGEVTHFESAFESPILM